MLWSQAGVSECLCCYHYSTQKLTNASMLSNTEWAMNAYNVLWTLKLFWLLWYCAWEMALFVSFLCWFIYGGRAQIHLVAIPQGRFNIFRLFICFIHSLFSLSQSLISVTLSFFLSVTRRFTPIKCAPFSWLIFSPIQFFYLQSKSFYISVVLNSWKLI